MGALSSYYKAFKASGCFGAALKAQKKGSNKKALEKANKGLQLLSLPGVIRSNPAEASVLVSLTILVEQIAYKTSQQGANTQDLCDTYILIKDNLDNGAFEEYEEWLPYITKKLGYEPKA